MNFTALLYFYLHFLGTSPSLLLKLSFQCIFVWIYALNIPILSPHSHSMFCSFTITISYNTFYFPIMLSTVVQLWISLSATPILLLHFPMCFSHPSSPPPFHLPSSHHPSPLLSSSLLPPPSHPNYPLLPSRPPLPPSLALPPSPSSFPSSLSLHAPIYYLMAVLVFVCFPEGILRTVYPEFLNAWEDLSIVSITEQLLVCR